MNKVSADAVKLAFQKRIDGDKARMPVTVFGIENANSGRLVAYIYNFKRYVCILTTIIVLIVIFSFFWCLFSDKFTKYA